MKYDVTYSCGHDGVVSLLGKGAERERKLAWYADCGLCPECYKAQLAKKEAAEPLTAHLSPTTKIDDNGHPIICVWLSGNTRPLKDDIKACGFYWVVREAGRDMMSLNDKRCWCIETTLPDLDNVIDAVKALGAIIDTHQNTMDIVAANVAAAAAKKYKDKQAAIAAIAKPVKPACISGGRWNGTIYGRHGNYSVYIDGEERVLSDSDVEDIKAYQSAKAEYDKKVAAIK